MGILANDAIPHTDRHTKISWKGYCFYFIFEFSEFPFWYSTAISHALSIVELPFRHSAAFLLCGGFYFDVPLPVHCFSLYCNSAISIFDYRFALLLMASFGYSTAISHLTFSSARNSGQIPLITCIEHGEYIIIVGCGSLSSSLEIF